jgi:hypothetical protein
MRMLGKHGNVSCDFAPAVMQLKISWLAPVVSKAFGVFIQPLPTPD